MDTPPFPLRHGFSQGYRAWLKLCFGLFFTLGLVVSAEAQLIVWDGSAGDGLYSNGENWVGGSPPADNNYSHTAVFGATATAGTITVPANHDVAGIRFETAGWTLSGGSFSNLGSVFSSGAGTNIIDQTINLHNDRTWTIETGNTLLVDGSSGSLYLRSNDLRLSGGGTLEVQHSMSGYGGSGTWGVFIRDAQMRINTASLFSGGVSSNAAIFIDDAAAILQVSGTLTQVNNLITANRIRDNLGSGLLVTDLGNGYVQVEAVPEPSGTILLLAGGILAIARRRSARQRL